MFLLSCSRTGPSFHYCNPVRPWWWHLPSSTFPTCCYNFWIRSNHAKRHQGFMRRSLVFPTVSVGLEGTWRVPCTSLGRSFAIRKLHICFFVFNDPWTFFFKRKLDPLIRLLGLNCLKRWPLHFTDTSLGRIRTWSLKNHEGVVWRLMHSSYCKTGVKLLLALWQTLHKVQCLCVFKGFLSVFKFSVCFWMFVNRTETEAYLPAPLDGHQTRRRPAFGAFAAGGNGGGAVHLYIQHFVDFLWRNLSLSAIKLTFCWIASDSG